MKRARKVSNFHSEVHFKQKQRLTITGIHSPEESTSVKAQSISLLIKLHAINIQLYQNWTPLRRLQETFITALMNN